MALTQWQAIITTTARFRNRKARRGLYPEDANFPWPTVGMHGPDWSGVKWLVVLTAAAILGISEICGVDADFDLTGLPKIIAPPL